MNYLGLVLGVMALCGGCATTKEAQIIHKEPVMPGMIVIDREVGRKIAPVEALSIKLKQLNKELTLTSAKNKEEVERLNQEITKVKNELWGEQIREAELVERKFRALEKQHEEQAKKAGYESEWNKEASREQMRHDLWKLYLDIEYIRDELAKQRTLQEKASKSSGDIPWYKQDLSEIEKRNEAIVRRKGLEFEYKNNIERYERLRTQYNKRFNETYIPPTFVKDIYYDLKQPIISNAMKPPRVGELPEQTINVNIPQQTSPLPNSSLPETSPSSGSSNIE